MKHPRIFVPLLIVVALSFGCKPSDSGKSGESQGKKAGPARKLESETGGKFVLIKGGEYTMGDPDGRSDETPHKVRVDSFYMETRPVTQELFKKVMGKDPSKWKGEGKPVEQMRWTDAADFCNKASELDGLKPCYDPKTYECDFSADGYRLPTEAEWEFASRAGSDTAYFFGDDKSKLGQYAWFKRNSGGKTRPVGKKLPNPYGLYDIVGNVWEWCNDFYAADYYKQSPVDNPRGPKTGQQRVLRGGAFDSTAKKCRSAYRFKENPSYGDVCFGYDSYGFRRVRSLQKTSSDSKK